MLTFRDHALEKELCLGGIHPKASISVFEDVTAYFKEPVEQILKGYWACRTGQDLVEQARVGEAKDEKDVLAYYQATPHYLYELSYWEASLR